MTAPLAPPPVPNIPLLRKVVEWAEAEAAKTDGTGLWNQAWYATDTNCGTAYCIAGFVCSVQPTFSVAEYFDVTIDGHSASWFDHGQRLLGLTDLEAVTLFAGDNTIEDVRGMAELIAARAGDRL